MAVSTGAVGGTNRYKRQDNVKQLVLQSQLCNLILDQKPALRDVDLGMNEGTTGATFKSLAFAVQQHTPHNG